MPIAPTKPTNVSEFLLSGKPAGRDALLFPRETCTYGALDTGSEHIARYILELGGRRGDRAVLVSDNSPFWVMAYLGILRAGLVCVPLAPSSTAAQLEHIVQVTEARFLFAQAAFVRRVQEPLDIVHLITDVALSEIDGAATQRDFGSISADASVPTTYFAPVARDDLAAIVFTSGSTGQPRGVMVTHANIIANTNSIIEYLELSGDDRLLAVLPFHYCFGASLLHTHMRVGGQLVIETRFVYTEAVLQRMAGTACTGFAGVPSHFQILLRGSTLRAKQFPHLRYVQQAGGSLPAPFLRELRDALPVAKIFVMYGQTEATARLSYLPPALLDCKAGSIGKGIPGVSLQVLNVRGSRVRPGEIGEIVAGGENVAKGYWRCPDETAATFRGGKLYTGDLATVDDDGFIYIVDRAKDFLKCRGERVSCRRIEEHLLGFDELVEAAVVGITDDVLGEAVKAFVVPRPTASDGLEQRVIRFCKSCMPAQFVPKQVVVLPALPKNEAGKVLKPVLRGLGETLAAQAAAAS